ncbi:MAG: Na/Pi cotransporter family protein, partial [Alphaproteobacteria bacterium]
LRNILARSTRHRLAGFAMGVVTAGALQSATATALLVMSFAGKGLIAAAPALAIMLGADLGSTLVVQVLSFDISWLSEVALIVGVLAFMAGGSALWRHLGRVAIGLGLMLMALDLIVGASAPFRDSPVLSSVVEALASDPILAVLLAALLTWLAHSSVAMVLLIMSLTVGGLVPVGLGVALVLGANAGAGLIPMMISMSESAPARRVPLGNLLFRVLGAVLCLPFIGLIVPYLGQIEGDPARQIANFHTLFNLALAVVFLPLVTVMAKVAERLLPDAPLPEDEGRPKYLDAASVGSSAVALACATREVLRMADMVETMLRGVIRVFADNDSKLLEQISRSDDDVDALHEAIKLYLTEVSRRPLDGEDSERFVELITFTTNLEHIGDIIDNNLLPIAQKKIKRKLEFSDEGWRELSDMHARAVDQLHLGVSVFVSRDVPMARRLLVEKERLRDLEREASERHLERLRDGQVEAIETSALHLDMLRDLKRITSHITSIAYTLLDAEGELRRSRLKEHLEGDDDEAEADTEIQVPAGGPVKRGS